SPNPWTAAFSVRADQKDNIVAGLATSASIFNSTRGGVEGGLPIRPSPLTISETALEGHRAGGFLHREQMLVRPLLVEGVCEPEVAAILLCIDRCDGRAEEGGARSARPHEVALIQDLDLFIAGGDTHGEVTGTGLAGKLLCERERSGRK